MMPRLAIFFTLMMTSAYFYLVPTLIAVVSLGALLFAKGFWDELNLIDKDD